MKTKDRPRRCQERPQLQHPSLHDRELEHPRGRRHLERAQSPDLVANPNDRDDQLTR